MINYKSLVTKIPISPDKKTKQKDYTGSKYPIIDQGKALIGGYTDNEKMLLNCDLPVIVFGDHTKAVKYIDFNFGAGADGIKVLYPKENVLPKYLYYGTIYLTFKIEDKGYARHYQFIERSELPVPPLADQHRIVTKIEELFSQLDSGVETLKKTKQQLAVYRQAVLKEAFEGHFANCDRLTTINDYNLIRYNNPVFKDISGDENEIDLNLSDSTIMIRIGEVFEVEVGATPRRNNPEYWNGDINWVSSGEVKFNTISVTAEKITQKGVDNSSTSIQPAGTVLLAMIGEGKTRGKAALLNVESAHNQNTAAILVSKTPCNPKYLFYFLLLNYENTRRVGSGNNQKALNKERVRALRFPFVAFVAQNKTVQEIESRLSVCDSIEKTVDEALQQAEALRQSILKKAFEGELI